MSKWTNEQKNIFNTNKVQVHVYLFSILEANLQAALPTNSRANLGR